MLCLSKLPNLSTNAVTLNNVNDCGLKDQGLKGYYLHLDHWELVLYKYCILLLLYLDP